MESSSVPNAAASGSALSEVVGAAEATVKNLSSENLMNDVALALKLFGEFKAATAGLHPTVFDVIKLLL